MTAPSTTSLFNLTSLFKSGAETFGAFDMDTTKGLLERLAANQPLNPDESQNPDDFQKLTLASDWVQHVVEKAGAQQTSLEELQRELSTLLDDDHLMVLLRYYQVSMRRLIAESERTPIVPRHLNDVNWRVDLELATGDMNKLITPSALLHLDLGSASNDEKVQ